MNLKEFEQEGQEQYESKFAWIFGHCSLDDEDKKELLNWHNQRTKKVYELGQQEMLAMVLKEIDRMYKSNPKRDDIFFGYNKALDILKEKLQAKQ